MSSLGSGNRDGFVGAVTGFIRYLGDREIELPADAAQEAVSALTHVDIVDVEDIFLAVRTQVISRVEDFPAYRAHFMEYWEIADPQIEQTGDSQRTDWKAGSAWVGQASSAGEQVAVQPETAPGRLDRHSENPVKSGEDLAPSEARRDDAQMERRASRGEPHSYSPQATSGGAPSEPTAPLRMGQKQALEVLVRAIVRQLALRDSRRWVIARRGSRVDPRRTWRMSTQTGGRPVRLAWRERKISKTRILALCDVSRSMEPYSQIVLNVVRALQYSPASVESFVFSTQLMRITGFLKQDKSVNALAKMQQNFPDWSGGTRLGISFQRLLREYGNGVNRNTVILIMSDGVDSGEPELVRSAMEALSRRAGFVVWLNPLLGTKGYRPRAKGMAAALPFVDLFVPVGEIDDLVELVRLMRRRLRRSDANGWEEGNSIVRVSGARAS